MKSLKLERGTEALLKVELKRLGNPTWLTSIVKGLPGAGKVNPKLMPSWVGRRLATSQIGNSPVLSIAGQECPQA